MAIYLYESERSKYVLVYFAIALLFGTVVCGLLLSKPSHAWGAGAVLFIFPLCFCILIALLVLFAIDAYSRKRWIIANTATFIGIILWGCILLGEQRNRQGVEDWLFWDRVMGSHQSSLATAEYKRHISRRGWDAVFSRLSYDQQLPLPLIDILIECFPDKETQIAASQEFIDQARVERIIQLEMEKPFNRHALHPLGANPGIDEEALWFLAKTQDEAALRGVLSNPKTSKALLIYIIESQAEKLETLDIREQTREYNVANDFWSMAQAKLAGRVDLTQEEMAELAASEHYRVRLALAHNRSVPHDILKNLGQTCT